MIPGASCTTVTSVVVRQRPGYPGCVIFPDVYLQQHINRTITYHVEHRSPLHCDFRGQDAWTTYSHTWSLRNASDPKVAGIHVVMTACSAIIPVARVNLSNSATTPMKVRINDIFGISTKILRSLFQTIDIDKKIHLASGCSPLISCTGRSREFSIVCSATCSASRYIRCAKRVLDEPRLS